MLTLNPGVTVLQSPNSVHPNISSHFNIFPPFSTVKFALRSHYASPKASFSMLKAKRREEDISSQPFDIEMDDEDDDDNEGYEARSGFRGREEEKNYDKDPEFAEILGSCLDDPEKARSKVSEQFKSIFVIFFADVYGFYVIENGFLIIFVICKNNLIDGDDLIVSDGG